MADTKCNTGGSAFPTSQDNTEYSERGMSLRDYFAAQMLPALVNEFWYSEDGTRHVAAAATAYKIADAMLAERDK